MANQADGTNYYEILEVAVDAPSHEIHKAYQRAKSTYSADNPALYSMFSPDEARELLRLVEEAYLILGNPTSRQTYDDGRLGKDSQAQVSMPLPSPASAPAQAPSAAFRSPDPVQVVSAHQSLPEFNAPAPSPSPHLSPSPSRQMPPTSSSSANKANLPPGTGRTSLSTYKVDDVFETELDSSSAYDGNLLQRARLYKNISIDRMSEATRISRTYLMAVEGNDYKSLPAAVFVRGFVVQMARVLGLDENKVASSYMKMFKAGGGK